MTKWLNNYTQFNAQQKVRELGDKKKSWVQAASVQVECLTFHALVKYRLYTSKNAQGLAFYM